MPDSALHKSRLAHWLSVLFFIWVLGAVGQVALLQAWALRFDFSHFYLDAEYVWRHGELNPDLDNPDRLKQRQLPFYLPAVSAVLAPLAAGGPKVAAILWTALHLAALGASLWMLANWRRRSADGESNLGPLALGVALALPAIYEAAKFNQLSFYILALALGGVRAVEKRRPWRAGLLLGTALVLKLLPGVFLLWLALKREWRALAATLLWAAALAGAPPLLLFGPQKTITYHREWFAHNVAGASANGMVDEDQQLDDHFIDRRNQSIPTVLSRLCWPGHRFRVEYQPLQLSREACVRLAYGVAVLLGLALIWRTRRPGVSLTSDAWRCEAAAYFLAMLIFSPLLRQYYLVWALPALVLLAHYALDRDPSKSRGLALAGLLVWLAGMALWLSRDARLLGAHLLMLIGLAGLLLGAAARDTKPRPDNAQSD